MKKWRCPAECATEQIQISQISQSKGKNPKKGAPFFFFLLLRNEKYEQNWHIRQNSQLNSKFSYKQVGICGTNWSFPRHGSRSRGCVWGCMAKRARVGVNRAHWVASMSPYNDHHTVRTHWTEGSVICCPWRQDAPALIGEMDSSGSVNAHSLFHLTERVRARAVFQVPVECLYLLYYYSVIADISIHVTLTCMALGLCTGRVWNTTVPHSIIILILKLLLLFTHNARTINDFGGQHAWMKRN